MIPNSPRKSPGRHNALCPRRQSQNVVNNGEEPSGSRRTRAHLFNRRVNPTTACKLKSQNTVNRQPLRQIDTSTETAKNYLIRLKFLNTDPVEPLNPSTEAEYPRDTTLTLEAQRDHNAKQATIVLGPHGTTVPKESFDKIEWSSASQATRSLLMLVFDVDRFVENFRNRWGAVMSRASLDQLKARDIIHCVRSKLNCLVKEVYLTYVAKPKTDTNLNDDSVEENGQ
uniref:BEN domain-containing protein n=1 Tax=Ceratitis capitata TaxID=7213 RepID=W8BK18_CERCA